MHVITLHYNYHTVYYSIDDRKLVFDEQSTKHFIPADYYLYFATIIVKCSKEMIKVKII